MDIDQQSMVKAASEVATVAAAAAQSPVSLGIIGAAWLYTFAPPGPQLKKNATPEEKAKHHEEAVKRGREVGLRILAAGVSSQFFGTWVVDVLEKVFPVLQVKAHPAPVLLLCGAAGWYFGRGLWLWFERRKNKDLGEQVKDAAQVIKDVKA